MTSTSPRPGGSAARTPARRRLVVLSAVGALGAAGLVPSASAFGASAASGPLVTLVGASKTITLSHFPGEDVFLDDLGVYAVSGAAALEVRTKRPDYRTAPHSDLVLRVAGRRTVTALPAGLVTGFDGLSAFTTRTVRNSRGAVVDRTQQTWCPGTSGASRMQPDAAATSPYPDFCASSPWSLGTVTGLPAHWASDVVSFGSFDPNAPQPAPLKDGTYTVTTTMSDAWRKVMGTPAARGTVRTTVVVRTVPLPTGGGVGGASSGPSGSASSGSAASVAGTASAAALRTTGGTGRTAALQAARRQFPASMPASLLGRADGALPAAGTAGVRSADFTGPTAEDVQSSVPGASPLAAPAGALDRASAGKVPNRYRPDLRALPAWGIAISGDPFDPLSKREYLTFAATVWNAGPAPLVVDGYRTPGADLMDAYQFFYDGKGRQVAWTGTGNMKYDPRKGHEHWHFLDFAKYELVTPSGAAILSQKEAFCLAPTDAVDLTVRGTRFRPNSTGLATACGQQQSIAIRETLDTGWGDTYAQYLPGQSFDVTDLANGTYTIRVTANPAGHLLEGSTANNVSTRTVVLGGTKGARTVKVLPVDGVDVP